MPELPEVETVRKVLKLWVNGKVIKGSNIFYNRVLENIEYEDFKEKIVNQQIHDVERIGKHLIFVLDDYVLLSHLRMEGKYYLVENEVMDEKMKKHKIISFLLDDGTTLLYHDVRKFGRMKLLDKNNYLNFSYAKVDISNLKADFFALYYGYVRITGFNGAYNLTCVTGI